MELTHTRDDGLSALLVGTNGEGGVFLSQLGETVVELGDVGLALGLYGDRNHSVGEGHRLEHDRMCLVAEGVTSADILETNTCADITSVD